MSTSDKDRIADFSADYRSVHSHKSKRTQQPAPEQHPHPQRHSPAPQKNAEKTVRPEPKQQKPARPNPLPVRNMDNETEIDDFLPKQDQIDGEQLLTKWTDGVETAPDTVPEPAARRRTQGKRRYGIFVGSLVLILALVGVGFIATEIGTRIHSALTDDSKLRACDKFLTVVVAQDPQPFASPDKADPDFVLNASLWQTMTENASNYTDYDDAGRTIVPLGDVADACHELFGPNSTLQPKNPGTETFYTYDAAKYQFHVALYSLDSTYIPYTVSSKSEGGGTVYRVGYVPPSDATRAQSGVSSGGKPSPTKYMDYVLKTNPTTKKQYIYAVRKAG